MNLDIITIRSESPADRAAVYVVNRTAFGRDDEANLVDDLRDGNYVRVSIVAEDRGRVVGHVLFSELSIVDKTTVVHALALAPLGVLPEFQGRGIGSRLVERGLETCRAAGHRIVIVLGEPAFYSRFGFSSQRAHTLRSPYAGPEFMALELEAGALEDVAGDVVYPPPFGAF